MRFRAFSHVAAFLALSAVLARPVVVVAVEPVSVVAIFLANYLLGKLLDERVDPLIDKDVRMLAARLEQLAEKDRQHQVEIARLKESLESCVTHQDLERTVLASLARMDRDLARVVARTTKLEQVQAEHADRLANLEQHGSQLDQGLAEMRAELARVSWERDSVLKYAAKKLPRPTRDSAAANARREGLELLRTGAYSEAAQRLEAARRVDHTDAGLCYCLAFALRSANQVEAAQRAVEEGVTLERKHGISDWYPATAQRLQGRNRVWLRDARLALVAPEVPELQLVRTPSGKFSVLRRTSTIER
ncbi:MAG: hypothetical protein U0836_27510 [Pirellulales bacterium]